MSLDPSPRAVTPAVASGIVTVWSDLPFAEALAAVVDAITARGLQVFDVIDHGAAATDEGLELRPTCVVVFGSPVAGTPLMVAHPELALELPLRLLVWEADDGATRLSHLAAADLAERFGVPPEAARPLSVPAAIVAELTSDRR